MAKLTPKVEDELPILESIGWVHLPKGWIVILTRSQGDKIIEKEILTEPESRSVAAERMRILMVRKVLAKARA